MAALFQKRADSKGGAFGGSPKSQTIAIMPKEKTPVRFFSGQAFYILDLQLFDGCGEHGFQRGSELGGSFLILGLFHFEHQAAKLINTGL